MNIHQKIIKNFWPIDRRVRCLITNLYSQKKYTISGYITDKNNGESIIGANIYSKLTGKGVSSNTYGFYSLTVDEGEHEIVYSFIGYKTEYKKFKLNKTSRTNHLRKYTEIKSNQKYLDILNKF